MHKALKTAGKPQADMMVRCKVPGCTYKMLDHKTVHKHLTQCLGKPPGKGDEAWFSKLPDAANIRSAAHADVANWEFVIGSPDRFKLECHVSESKATMKSVLNNPSSARHDMLVQLSQQIYDGLEPNLGDQMHLSLML